MHKFQIRFADTGYPQKYEKVTSIQMLQQLVYKQYKIQKNNQKLISKKGVIITGTDKLDNENALKKTFSADPNNPSSMTQVMGMYLFNHKDLLKSHSDENIQNLEEFSLNILRKRHQTCLGLRPKIYELQPLSKKFSPQQLSKINNYNPSLISTANQWHGLTFQLINLGQTSKQTQQCFVEYIQKWENQRKSLYVLGKNLQVLYEQKKELLKKFTVSLEAAKNRFDPIMKNEQRSSYLSSKGQQYREAIEGLTGRINVLSQQLSSMFKKITIYRKNVKSTHIDLEKNIKLIDEYKKKKSKQIERLFSEMKQTYSAFVEGIREKLDRSNDSKLISILAERKNIDRKYLEYRKTCSDIIRDMQVKFVEMIGYYVTHGQMVRTEYRNYHEIFCQVEQNIKSSCLKFQSDLYNLHKGIQQFVKVNQSLDSDLSYQNIQLKLQSFQDQQQKRRYIFNTRLSNLQQQIKQILKQQEQTRIKFVEQIFGIDQMYQNQLLINTRVPCIFVNYDECSDRQLVGKWKLVSSGVKDKQNRQIFSNIDLQIYTDSRGLDRILKQMEQIKNYQVSLKSETLNNDTKTKNLQILLQKSADIFHHIYSNKILNLEKQWNQNQKNLQDQIGRLQRQNKELQNRLYRYSENLNIDIENRRQIEVQMLRLTNEVQLHIDQKFVMQARYGDILRDYEKRLKQAQNGIEQYKKQVMKLRAQKRQIEEKFVDEIKGMQNFVIAFEESEKAIKEMKQINNEYKIVMGDQAVRIANLEEELEKVLKSKSLQIEKQMVYEQQLKNKCYGDYKENDLSIDYKYDDSQACENPREIKLEKKGIKSNEIQLIQREIQKLEMQIEQLKQENEQLKQENVNLNEEIVKIAMKDVEDVEVQTEKMFQKQQENSISNFVSQELSVSLINNRHEAIQNTVNLIELIHYKNCPEVGQLRMFVPFSSGLYVALKSESRLIHTLPPPLNLTLQTRNYLNIHQNQLFSHENNRSMSYILDMNCLNSKSRQLLTQCSLVVVVKISKLIPGFEGSNKYYVEGEIKAAFGFEDDDMTVRDYTPFIMK